MALLPNSEQAIVELEKLRDYCLSSTHPRGRHKARVFRATLGLSAGDATWLRAVILTEVQLRDCTLGELDDFGQRYWVDCLVERGNRSAWVCTAWIVRTGEGAPRFTTCFVR